MTYNASEISFQSGAPVELYEFARGTQIWRYTSADADVMVGSSVYQTANIKRTEIEISQERARNAVKLTTPRDFAIADMFRITPPTDVILLTIKRYHRSDPSSQAVIWMGRLLNVEWQGSQAQINCEPVSTSMRRPGLRRLYQRQCPHALYSTACGIAKAAQAHVTTITDITGSSITVASLLSKSYAGGFLERDVGSNGIERRFIKAFSGLTLQLALPYVGGVGDEITVYPGCDHTTATCGGVYSNLPNYGGFPSIPEKNPFGGDPVY